MFFIVVLRDTLKNIIQRLIILLRNVFMMTVVDWWMANIPMRGARERRINTQHRIPDTLSLTEEESWLKDGMPGKNPIDTRPTNGRNNG